MSKGEYMIQPLIRIVVQFPKGFHIDDFYAWAGANGVHSQNLYGHSVSSDSLRRTVGDLHIFDFEIANAEKVVEWLKASGLEPRK